MDILVDTLVHIFTVLELTTKYCHLTAERDSYLKKVFMRLFRRMRMFKHLTAGDAMLIICLPEGDYFRVLIDKSGAQEALAELDTLTQRENLVTAANTYAVVREGNLLIVTYHSFRMLISLTVLDEAGRIGFVYRVDFPCLIICCSYQWHSIVAFSAQPATLELR